MSNRGGHDKKSGAPPARAAAAAAAAAPAADSYSEDESTSAFAASASPPRRPRRGDEQRLAHKYSPSTLIRNSAHKYSPSTLPSIRNHHEQSSSAHRRQRGIAVPAVPPAPRTSSRSSLERISFRWARWVGVFKCKLRVSQPPSLSLLRELW